jgi:MFS-type transporter involved in bile tolerance (Atg22 family)
MEENKSDNNFKNTPEYQKITDKFFYASLTNIPILALPAFGALFLGKFLDNKFETNKTITLILLLLAIVFSWFLILRNNRKINREYKKIREEMEKQ